MFLFFDGLVSGFGIFAFWMPSFFGNPEGNYGSWDFGFGNYVFPVLGDSGCFVLICYLGIFGC